MPLNFRLVASQKTAVAGAPESFTLGSQHLVMRACDAWSQGQWLAAASSRMVWQVPWPEQSLGHDERRQPLPS